MSSSMPPDVLAPAVWNLLQSHHSARDFKPDLLDDATLNNVLECGLRAPNWNNGQHVTAVVVRDAQRRQRMSELCGNQASIAHAPVFVVLVMDFCRTAMASEHHARTQRVHENQNAVLIGAVDVGIVLGTMMAAARAAGLIVCPIGGVRRDSAAVCELLELPELTYPMAGLCLGYPVKASNIRKPRIGLSGFAHEERYQPERSRECVVPLDAEYVDYSLAMGKQDAPTWSDWISQRYAKPDYTDVAQVLAKQGFHLG